MMDDVDFLIRSNEMLEAKVERLEALYKEESLKRSVDKGTIRALSVENSNLIRKLVRSHAPASDTQEPDDD